MPKFTVLEMVQDILSEMNSDEVNSIDDTVESEQVAQMVKTAYYNLITTRNWPHLKKMFQPTDSGTTAKPTHVRVDDSVKEMEWIKYNTRSVNDEKDTYENMRWCEPEEFIERTNNRNSSQDHVSTITDFSGVKILIRNDKAPEYYTSFDDDWLVFDSYDSEVDDTLHSAKFQAYGAIETEFELDDDFIPDMPEEAFTVLLAEAKSMAFLAERQMMNDKAEQHARSGQRWLARKAWRTHGGIKTPNYGRRARGLKGSYNKSPYFDKDSV